MDENRYVQLTDAGLKRLNAARRKYAITVEDIVAARDTPSINTVKKALRQERVFVRTLERIWDCLRREATQNRETLSCLAEGEDYAF